MDFENFEFLGFRDFGIVGSLGSGVLGVRDFDTLRFWVFWILRPLDFGMFGILGCWNFFDFPLTHIPETGFFNFYFYSGGSLIEPAIRSRCLLRRPRSRDALADSGEGSRGHHLLNR